MLEKIRFSLINKTKQEIPHGYFLSVLKNFLKKMGIKNPIEVNLILVGNAYMRSLNKKYRKIDKPTDVLSFPIDIINPKKIPKAGIIILGDIYICPELVETQNFASLQKTFLHGLIHLIGYDHEKNKKEWEKVLKKLSAK